MILPSTISATQYVRYISTWACELRSPASLSIPVWKIFGIVQLKARVISIIPYFVVGIIHYHAADEDGKLIYIKPAYHGTEGAAIRSYAMANKTFPHETTADQWFT